MTAAVNHLAEQGSGVVKQFAGLSLDRPRIMGVINVTPDSFSDGGETFTTEAAVDRGFRLLDEGADIIDVGGESTRPGAAPVDPIEEAKRVIPVVRRLAACGAIVSVDTRHANVMKAALDAGTRVVNDVSALSGDSNAISVIAASDVSVILMHMQGDPRTMQRQPFYREVAQDVFHWLRERATACENHGIAKDRISIDPGIGFGKTVEHNVSILSQLGLYRDLAYPVTIGVSRKSFIARLSGDVPPRERLAGSLAAVLSAVSNGASILRVHDVWQTRQALAVWEAVN
ncbi:MAG: dihydropteroate synthase [Hyphomicrobiales bacterium]|nr:dihydropteroate synthase [Hyphomicrobiales bacterium]